MSDVDDDDVVPTANTYPQTKNEIIDAAITIPDIDEVGPDETLEKVGEIISIVDNVVIVRGLASEYANRGSERALDSDTLLVFGDRKVMGYVRAITFYPILFIDAIPGRYTKPLARLRSLCIKSGSTRHSPLIRQKSKWDARSSTYLGGAALYLSIISNN